MSEHKQSQQARKLLQKYLDGKCTPGEEEQVLNWFYSFEEKENSLPDGITEADFKTTLTQRLDEELFHNHQPDPEKNVVILRRLFVAALVLFVSGIAIWMYLDRLPQVEDTALLAAEVPSLNNANQNDILPGGHYAKFIYADGKEQIRRDSTFFTFTPLDSHNRNRVAIEVPHAGIYKIILEDGTKVWLNAATKLSYPERFDDDQRLVSLEGEAYFEVAKDIHRPFLIDAHGTTIEVLGTAFNVNAYESDVKTYLVEGSVKVKKGMQENMLRPGQEAVVLDDHIQIAETDLEKNTAWQRGEFYFDGSNLPEIISRISHWYNVEFENEELLQGESTYKGAIKRNTNLSTALKILEVATGKSFIIKGRKVEIQ